MKYRRMLLENARILFIPLLIAILTLGCKEHNLEPKINPAPNASIQLLPRSSAFVIDEVPQGAVHFTASIRNDGPTAMTIAHPSICFPAGYKQGETRYPEDSRGKSEILLKITKPDGTDVVLRDGYMHFFDPGNVPLITIPPHGTGTFDLGWFFQNARGRWEQDDEAAKVFLLKGEYKVRVLFRNLFPMAALYDEELKGSKFIDVWTGEMESAGIAIEVE